MLAVHEQVVLMSKMRLLLNVHEQFPISLHLSVFHYLICGYCFMQTTSAIES